MTILIESQATIRDRDAAMINLTGYKLTFDDEFNALSVSQSGAATKWADIRETQRLNANADIGFGQSAFVDAASGINPFSIGGGALTITAVKAPSSIVGPGTFASGLLHTKASFSQTYGYFEMRADTPVGPGAWSAFWMMPADGSWPPELDIMENYGNGELYQTVHTAQGGKHTYDSLYSAQPTITSGYHTYGAAWTATTIDFYFDGKLVGTRKTPADMNKPMYLLVDLAVSKNPNVTSDPKALKVDYIRAFSKDPDAVAVALDTISSPDGADTSNLYGASSAAKPIPTAPITAPVAQPVPPVVKPGPDLSHTKQYDKANVLIREVITHADQSKDVYAYHIAGKPHTTAHDSYDKAGILVATEQSRADGTLVYTFSRETDGTKIVDRYDAKGSLSSHQATAPNGTSSEKGYVDGVLKSERTTYASGSPDLSETKTYVEGVLTRKVVVHADRSKDIDNFAVKGKSYVSEHSAYDAAGKLLFSDEVGRDGSHVTSLYGSGLTFTAKEGVSDTFRNLGAGADTFVFHEDFGKDAIRGFHVSGAGRDLIQIDDTLAANFAELKAMMHSTGPSGADTLITFDSHDSLTLVGVKAKDLSAVHFVFQHDHLA